LAQRTSITNARVEHDGYALGPCSPRDIPDWLDRARKKLRVTWQPFRVKTNLLGRKRAALLAWLETARSR